MAAVESPLTPTAFAYDEAARALRVEWADGAVHRIPFATLRRDCPCAVCRGEMGRPGRFDARPELRPGEDELADIQLVGHYAVSVLWQDGHGTGIHTFERLRALGERVSRPAGPPGAPGGSPPPPSA